MDPVLFVFSVPPSGARRGVEKSLGLPRLAPPFRTREIFRQPDRLHPPEVTTFTDNHCLSLLTFLSVPEIYVSPTRAPSPPSLPDFLSLLYESVVEDSLVFSLWIRVGTRSPFAQG